MMKPIIIVINVLIKTFKEDSDQHGQRYREPERLVSFFSVLGSGAGDRCAGTDAWHRSRRATTFVWTQLESLSRMLRLHMEMSLTPMAVGCFPKVLS